MKRRTIITAAATAATGAVAGCLGNGSSDGGGPDDDPAGTPTPAETPTPTDGETRLADTEFEVTNVECGTTGSGHNVRKSDGQVTVEGRLDGPDSCYTAELVRDEYDAETDTLYVTVDAVKKDDADVCSDCIVNIYYIATFEFENGEPGTVEVENRGATSGSASSGESVSESPSDVETGGTPTEPADY